MSDEPASLKSCFYAAETSRQRLEGLPSSAEQSHIELQKGLANYRKCLDIADQVSLFSPNETLEDVASSDLQYFLIDFHISELLFRQQDGLRQQILIGARTAIESFFKLLDSYDILSKEEAQLYERYKDSPNKFSTASTTDPAARRNAKITRFREEKALKAKLDQLRSNPSLLANDDAALRDLHLLAIHYAAHQSFASLESIAQELHILSLAPPNPTPSSNAPPFDPRTRSRQDAGFSERLDPPSLLAASNAGPILDKSGKPLRPFTILDKRAEIRAGVFRPDHSLPTMSIDEYLEEERRRGGIIEGGGAKSGIKPEVDEDDMEIADRETLKARQWDDYKDENPRGAGNTMNMG